MVSPLKRGCGLGVCWGRRSGYRHPRSRACRRAPRSSCLLLRGIPLCHCPAQAGLRPVGKARRRVNVGVGPAAGLLCAAEGEGPRRKVSVALFMAGALVAHGSLKIFGALRYHGSLLPIGALVWLGSLAALGALGHVGSLAFPGALLVSGSLSFPGALNLDGCLTSASSAASDSACGLPLHGSGYTAYPAVSRAPPRRPRGASGSGRA